MKSRSKPLLLNLLVPALIAMFLTVPSYDLNAASSALAPALLQATGPLRILSSNSRYFSDGSGKAIYLAGSQGGFEMQDDAWGGWQASGVHVTSNFTHYLDVLQSHNANLLRMWTVETSGWDLNPSVSANPMQYVRTGPGNGLNGQPRFDLSQFNQTYFDRLRARAIAAYARGIYVAVMLFDGFSTEHPSDNGGNPWFGHPYNGSNNINGIDGDATQVHTLSASAAINALQKAYVRKVIDTVGDLDNILYEIANESTTQSQSWQYDMINYIKDYEASRAKQHPVVMSASWGQNDSVLFASPADGIAPSDLPSSDYQNNPPPASGQKVVIVDIDHINYRSKDPQFVWKNFLRGNNPIIYDWHMVPFNWDTGRVVADDGSWEPMRHALGNTRIYADKMNLTAMAPRGDLSSTGYALADFGNEYLVYQPGSGAFTVNLISGTYSYEWFNPTTRTTSSIGAHTASNGSQSFTPPFSGSAILYLKGVASPDTITPNPPANTPTTNGPAVTTRQSTHVAGAAVQVNFSNASGNVQDWIGIFAAGAPNTANLAWRYTDGTYNGRAGITRGSVSFTDLTQPGNYEARLFFNNTTSLEAKASFTVVTTLGPVVNSRPVARVPRVVTKATYATGEAIQVNIANASGNAYDWVGIFPAGAPQTAHLAWRYTDGTYTGTAGITNRTVSFTGMTKPGNYEARLFFNNTRVLKASVAFKVK